MDDQERRPIAHGSGGRSSGTPGVKPRYPRSLPFVASLLLSVSAAALAQGWNALPDLLAARQEIAGAMLDEELVVVGGFSSAGAALASAESYAPGAASWRSLPDIPVAVHHPAAAVVNGQLIVIGGYPGGGLLEATDAVQIFDPVTGAWHLGTPMPAARGGLAAVAVDDRVIVAGGANNGHSVTDVRSYDPATDTWAELPPMATARDHLALAVLAGRVHALGGRNQQSFTLAVHEVYDPAANSWSTATPLPTGRSGHAAAVSGACLYALGGEGNDARRDGLFPHVERYSAATDKWTELEPMPNPRHGMSAVAVDGRIVVVGGGAVAGMGAVGLVDEFVPGECQ